MRCYEITLNDDTHIQLRLTSAKLEWYLKETQSDQQNPLLGVLDAVAILGKRIKLLTAALQWPKNTNTVKDGAELLDLLLDDGMAPSEISDMILKLACQAGLMEENELESMMAANAVGTVKFRDALRDFLAGKTPAAAETAPQDSGGQEANPTAAPEQP